MALVTALDIIKGAMLRVGVLDPIEQPTAEQTAVCLDALNALLDGLQTEPLTSTNNAELVATMVGGSQTLTIGPGQQVDIPRPVDIAGVYCRLGGIDYAAELVSKAEYDAITVKAIGTSWPLVCWYDGNLPTGALHFWPAPSATVEVHVTINAQLQDYKLATDAQLMPQGARRALTLALAVEICPIFGAPPSPQLERDSSSAMRSLKRARADIPETTPAPRLTRLGGFLSGL